MTSQQSTFLPRRPIMEAAFPLVLGLGLMAAPIKAQGMTEDRAAPALVRALADRETRAEAHAALLAMGSDAVPALVMKLTIEPDQLGPDVAKPVLAVLEDLGSKAVMGVRTLAALRPVASYTWRAELDNTLLWVWPYQPDFWNDPRDFDTEYLDAHFTTRRNPGYRKGILTGIHRLRRVRNEGLDPRDPARCVGFLTDVDPELRRLATEVVRSDPDVARAALPEIADAVRYPMPLAPIAKRFQESRNLVELVLEFAPDDPMAVTSYGYLLIFGETKEVRLRGVAGLAKMGPAAQKLYRYMPWILEHDPSREVRLALVRAMGELGEAAGEAGITLQHLTGHSDPRFRKAAEEALRKIRGS